MAEKQKDIEHELTQRKFQECHAKFEDELIKKRKQESESISQILKQQMEYNRLKKTIEDQEQNLPESVIFGQRQLNNIAHR